MPTPMTKKFTTARNSRARSLKSSSEDRIEMRVCETRKRASYRSVAAVPAPLCWVSLISIRGFDLTAFHKCLGPEDRKTTLVRIRAVNKIHPRGHRRHSAPSSTPPPSRSAIRLWKSCRQALSRWRGGRYACRGLEVGLRISLVPQLEASYDRTP